ncbi:MAG: class I SAM-dependent methyltransferase [bacterium]|nr:class I SAM-dependent methyltransferase [bacterium]
MDNIDANNTVLDIGCGKGEVARSVSQKAKEVVGIDISNKNIQLADENKTPTNLSYIVGDATTYRFNQKFDVIILSNVLEHIKNRVDFLKKLSGIAPRILIRVPMITRDWISVYKKNEGFAYRLDDTHYIEYDLHSFFKEIKEANLKILHYHINFGELYAVVQKLEK